MLTTQTHYTIFKTCYIQKHIHTHIHPHKGLGGAYELNPNASNTLTGTTTGNLAPGSGSYCQVCLDRINGDVKNMRQDVGVVLVVF